MVFFFFFFISCEIMIIYFHGDTLVRQRLTHWYIIIHVWRGLLFLARIPRLGGLTNRRYIACEHRAVGPRYVGPGADDVAATAGKGPILSKIFFFIKRHVRAGSKLLASLAIAHQSCSNKTAFDCRYGKIMVIIYCATFHSPAVHSRGSINRTFFDELHHRRVPSGVNIVT